MTKKVAQVIGELRGGLPAKAADQLLEDAIRAARQTGKKAVITVQLTIEPHGSENRELWISMQSSAKLPKDPNLLEPSVYFVNRRTGAMTRDDTEQENLPGVYGVDSANGGSPAENRGVG